MNAGENINRKIFDQRLREQETLDYRNITGRHGPRDRRVINILKNYGVEGRACLDVGPGTGRWLQFLEDEGAETLAAVDISSEALARAKEIGARCQRVDLEREPLDFPSRGFDITLAFMVLEHLRDPELFVREILRVTKKKGLLLLTIPNIASFRSRIRLLLGILPLAVSQDPTHVAFYRPRQLRELFQPHGAQVEIIPTSFSLHPFDSRKLRIPTNRLLSGLDDDILFRVSLPE